MAAGFAEAGSRFGEGVFVYGEVAMNAMSPLPFGTAPLNDTGREETVAQVDRLGVIFELVGMLLLVTQSGQDHVMRRVLTILGLEVTRAAIPLTDARHIVLTRNLKDLGREADRTSPDIRAFAARARAIVGLLPPAERGRHPDMRGPSKVYPVLGPIE